MPEHESGIDRTAKSRTEVLRAALAYAERGIPVFPLRPGGKAPITRRGHLDATTDKSRITAWLNANPGANIGIPTGMRSGLLVLDVDPDKWGFGSLEALEGEYGELPATTTVRTGSGGMHYYFRYPEGEEVRNSAGKLGPGLDIRGEGGYVVAPPSRTTGSYEYLERLPVAGAPEWLLEKLREPKQRPEKVSGNQTPTPIPPAGEIPAGRRNAALASIAGRLHDGTRTLDELTADLLEINAERCAPPLPDQEVERIAKSIHRREPCRPRGGGARERPREVGELVEVLDDFWRSARWEGLAGKSEARFARALIREGRRSGTAIPAGLRVEISFRQLAEVLGCHRNTIANIARRGKAAGWLRQDNATRSGETPGAFVLLDPRRACDTYPPGSDIKKEAVDEGVTNLSRPRSVADLETPHFRHRGPVGYSREHTLCILEARGPQSRESLAAALGWARARDLERGHLQPLVELGLLEKRGKLYAVAGDYARRAEEARSRPYGTLRRRRVSRRSPEGRAVSVVEEAGSYASEDERARLAREAHAREREAFRNRRRLRLDLHLANAAGADGLVEELRPAHEGSEAAEPEKREPEQDPAVAVVLGYVERLGKIRVGLLQDVWLHDHGGDLAQLRRAVEASGVRRERLPEFGGAEFLFPPRRPGEAA